MWNQRLSIKRSVIAWFNPILHHGRLRAVDPVVINTIKYGFYFGHIYHSTIGYINKSSYHHVAYSYMAFFIKYYICYYYYNNYINNIDYIDYRTLHIIRYINNRNYILTIF